MSSLFDIRENIHNTRHFQVLSNESRRTVDYGSRTMLYSTLSLGNPTARIETFKFFKYVGKKNKKFETRKLSR